MNKKTTRNILLVLVALAVIVLIANGSFQKLEILPGFEGEQAGNYGFQPTTYSSVYALGNALPGNYFWVGVPTPQSASVLYLTTDWLGLKHQDTLEVDVQNNLIMGQTPSIPTVVKYYVNLGNGTYKLVVGDIEVYTYSINALITSQSAGYFDFGGATMWQNLISNVWSTQSTDPFNSSINGYVFETPLYGVVEAVSWQAGQGSNNCNLCTVGASLTFYSSPNAAGQTLASLVQWTPSASTSNINSSLSSIAAPDQRMQRLVYYPLTFTSFKGCTLISYGCTFPNVHITIQLYTLRIGEYIITNPSTTGLSANNQSNCQGIGCLQVGLNALWKQLTSPVGLLFIGIASVGFLLILVVIILVIYVVFIRRVRRET